MAGIIQQMKSQLRDTVSEVLLPFRFSVVLPAVFMALSFSISFAEIAGGGAANLFAFSETAVWGALIFCGGLIIAYCLIAWLYWLLDKACAVRNLDDPGKLAKKLFRDHPFAIPFLILIVVYVIHFAVVLPGVTSQDDTRDQIAQFFNLSNFRADQVVLISPDVRLTNHHPVLHTLMVGGCVQLGGMLGNYNTGFFIYTLIQMLLFVVAMACVFPFFERHNAPWWLRWATLLFFVLCPKLWNFSTLITKDTVFSAFVLLYLIALADYLMGRKDGALTAKLLLFGLAVCLFRNNGVFVVLFSLPFLLLMRPAGSTAEHPPRGPFVAATSSMVIYAMVITLLLPALSITGGSVRETLSVPLQQTARYIIDNPDDITEEEMSSIEAVYNVEKATASYDPELADRVKDEFYKDASSEAISEFMKTWVAWGLRHPITYLAASVDNHYGYYCFTQTGYEWKQSPTWARYKMENGNKRIEELSDGAIVLDYHAYWPDEVIDATTAAYEWFAGLPLVAQLMQAAFYFWLLVLALIYALRKRNVLVLALVLPLLTLYLIGLLGPANAVGYTRYIMPAMLAWPLVLACLVGSKEPDAGSTMQAKHVSKELRGKHSSSSR